MLSKFIDHQILYFYGLLIISAGLPCSKALLSIGVIWVSVNWVLELNYKEKILRWWNDKLAVLFTALFVIHIAGLIYTEDFQYAFKDIRIKLPLLCFPFVFKAIRPLKKWKWELILAVFVSSVTVVTILCFLVYLKLFVPERDTSDVRNISIYVSHIRLSLMCCFSIFILFYFFFNYKGTWKRITCIVVSIWLVFFMTILQSLTGLIIIILCVIVLMTISIFKQKNYFIKRASTIALVILVSIPVIYTTQTVFNYYNKPKINLKKLKKTTKYGRNYSHNIESKLTENENYVWLYVCDEELETTWNKVSKINYRSKDKKGQPLYSTLIRYMTSKGLRKDQEGVEKLNADDVKNIELGITNELDHKSLGIRKRINQLLFEIDSYSKSGNASGQSLTQRLEYWKTGFGIAKNNLLIGVGTGDVKVTFDNAYENNNSMLEKKYRHRAHNQYLTFLITFGIPGLILFLAVLIAPLLKKPISSLYLSFFIIASMSFISEDTLETQAGVSFFAFFNYFLLLIKVKPSVPNKKQSLLE